MNFAKINTFLLIAVILILAAIFYFVFVNKKDMNALWDILQPVSKKSTKDKARENSEEQAEPETSNLKHETAVIEPSEDDWKFIYSISEKLYFKKPLTVYEKNLKDKFPEQIAKDLEFCNEFYPVVVAMVDGTELTDDQKAFYEVNAADVDAEVEHRRNLPGSGQQAAGKEQPEAGKQRTGSDNLEKGKPPLAIAERNNLILSFFEDKIPKTAKKLYELYTAATGHDYGKNWYRVMASLEGKFLTPQKKGKITYYCLPEWFDGRKLKEQFKAQLV